MKPAKLSLIIALALGTFVALAPPVRAQDNSSDTSTDAAPKSEKATSKVRVRRQGQNQVDQLATQLKLNDEQKTKLQPVLQEERKKLAELRQDSTLNAKDRRAKVREVHDATNQKVQGFLNKDQFDQFKKLHEQGNVRTVRRAGNVNTDHSTTSSSGSASSNSTTEK